MSTTTPRPPLYGNDAITKDAIAQGDASMAANGIDFAAGERSRGYTNGAVDTRDHYEATWGPLIQQLVDALALIGTRDEHSGHVCEAIAHSPTMYHEGYDPCPGIRRINEALAAATIHHFTPSQP